MWPFIVAVVTWIVGQITIHNIKRAVFRLALKMGLEEVIKHVNANEAAQLQQSFFTGPEVVYYH